MAGRAAGAGQPGGRRSTSPRGARDWPAGITGGKCAALCSAQAAAPVELRRARLSPRGFGFVSRLCPPALGVVAEESVLPDDRRPSRRNLEAVNQALLASAKQDRLESGATVRLDSTVSAAIMHQPSDSTLLWDAVRVMTRLLRQAQSLPGAPAVGWRDRRRAAKKRARATSTAAGRTRSAGSMAN